jgi:hypothetical protein
LLAMIEALLSAGTKMRVWCQEGHIEEKLLYAPAFVAELPHWSSEETGRAWEVNWTGTETEFTG